MSDVCRTHKLYALSLCAYASFTGEHGALHACVGDVAEVTVDLVSRLPEPLTVTNAALRLKLIQETAGAAD